jgi:hypothetical protein
MSVVAYVSGHGLGHASREVQILRRLPEEIPLIVKTGSPAWFWESEVSRPFTLLNETFDVGCVQKDSIRVDIDATREAKHKMDVANRVLFDVERRWLESVGAKVVVCDIAAFPLTVAASLGIPALLVANFTWSDIYAPYPGFDAINARLRAAYGHADLLLDAGLSLPMNYFEKRKSVGLVARVGRSRREELPQNDKKRALIYAGNWGMPLAWERLKDFKGWHFLTLTPPGSMRPPNLTALPQTLMPHDDLVASVDLVISKPGYGIVGECLANGTPLLYGPREEFAEYEALDAALQSWSGGLKVSGEDFIQLKWKETLDCCPELDSVERMPAPGAESAAECIERVWRGAAPGNLDGASGSGL